MHVLYFHQHFSTPKGATGTRSYEMAQKLIKRGHQVTMVCGSYNVGATGLECEFIDGRREGKVDGIKVIEFDLRYANNDSFFERTKQFLKFALQSFWLALNLDYDVLFATSTPLTAALPGIAAKFFRRKPFVFEVRDLWPELPKAMGVITNPLILGGMSVLEWLSYHSADECIGLSPGIQSGIKKRAPQTTPVHMVPNGCDIDFFAAHFGDCVLPEGITTDTFVACFTGAHGMANGLENILDAAEVLKQRGETSIAFLFVGEGKTKPALKARASESGLDNCQFLDAMPKPELAKLLHRADVGLMTLANVPEFYYGTSPNKFFDYLSCGLPVLNNYPGWLADMITEHECGEVVPPEDAEAFADALQRMAADRQRLKTMGENGLALAKKEFDRNRLSDRFSDVIEGALA